MHRVPDAGGRRRALPGVRERRPTERAAHEARRGDANAIIAAAYALIGINLVVFVLELITRGYEGVVFQQFAYHGGLTELQPWRMITSTFLHSPGSILHILFNMYSLFIFGPLIENAVGRARFLALYLLAGFGGSVGVLLLAPSIVVVGASGAIFGLLGAFFVIQRRLGGNSMQLVIIIGLNLAIGFIVPNVAWQAHLGGLIVGGLVAAIYVRTRRRDQRTLQRLGLAAVTLALVGVTIAAVTV